MLLARAGGRRTERQPGNSRWAAKAFALSHCPEPEAECDTSFSLPFCYSLLGSTVTAGAAKLTTFLHLFTPTHCLAACANHCSPSVHYPLHFFLMNCFRNKTCLRKLQKQLGVQCSFDREFCFQRVFIVGLVLVLKNEEFDLGIWQILKRWPSAGMMRVHGCSLVNSLASALLDLLQVYQPVSDAPLPSFFCFI